MSVEDVKLLTDAIVWTDGAQYFDVESGFQIIDDGIAVYVNGVMLAKDKFVFDSNSRRVEFAGGYSPVAGDHIQVGRDIVPAQENTLSAYSGYNRELFEKMFDKLTLMCVEFKEKLNRALMVNTLAEDGKAAEMVETLSRLPQEISQIQSDLDNLFEDMNANEVEFASLHTAVNSLRDSLANVVTLLNDKAAKNHTHTSADITGLDDAFNTLESTLTALTNTVNGKADAKHTHSTSDISGFDTAVSAAVAGKADKGEVISLNTTLSSHTTNSTIHVTLDEKKAWNAKANLPSGGLSGQVLTTDGSGNISWTTPKEGTAVNVDSELSATSTNPVQNAVITNKINELSGAVNSLNTSLTGVEDSLVELVTTVEGI